MYLSGKASQLKPGITSGQRKKRAIVNLWSRNVICAAKNAGDEDSQEHGLSAMLSCAGAAGIDIL